MSFVHAQFMVKKHHAHTKLGFFMLVAVSMALPVNGHAACKLPKSYYKNVTCTADSQYFLASKDNKTPVALLDKSGKKVADLMGLQAADGNKIRNGVMPVKRYDKVGYVDMTGEIVVPIKYDSLGKTNWARSANNGLIVVKKNGAFGVVNTKGDVLIAFSRDISALSDFKNGKARMTKAGTKYWLDSSGKVSPINAASTNVRASTKTNAKTNPKSANLANDADAKVDASTQPYVPIDPSLLNYTPHTMDGKWGFVDENNVTVITYSFDEVMPFSENLAGVRLGDKWGFIDKGGRLQIGFRFDDAGIDKASTQAGQQNTPFRFIGGKA